MAKSERSSKRRKAPAGTASKRRVRSRTGTVPSPALLQLRRDAEIAAAVVWNQLSSAQQQQLAWEVASSRAHELRLAYPSLVAIGAGYRIRNEPTREVRKRAGRLPKMVITDEPCVIFTVAKKWKKPRVARGSKERTGAMPKCLLAYTDDPTVPGRRVIAAVPTDVRERQSAHARQGTAARGLIVAQSVGRPPHFGILACAVTLPGRSGMFAIGAHHVLAMSITNGIPVNDAEILLRGSGSSDESRIGSLVTDPIGSISPGQVAFDAALVSIDDGVTAEVLREATGGMTANDYWRDSGAFPRDCRVLVGTRERPLRAVFTQRRVVFGDTGDEIVYFKGLRQQPIHPVMLEFHVDPQEARSTLPGESGCPIVTADGSTFVAMHIGGVQEPSKVIWAIPSTELFLASRWKLDSPPVLSAI